MSWQTVQTQIRLLLRKQSDQGLLCLLYWQVFLWITALICILWIPALISNILIENRKRKVFESLEHLPQAFWYIKISLVIIAQWAICFSAPQILYGFMLVVLCCCFCGDICTCWWICWCTYSILGCYNLKRASAQENLSSGVCKSQRHRPVCTSVQTDQCLCYLLIGKYHILTWCKWNFTFLASLCSWAGSLEYPQHMFFGEI